MIDEQRCARAAGAWRDRELVVPGAGRSRFDAVCPTVPCVLLPDAPFDPAEVHYAAVWKPKPGELAAFPNLRVIFNLGAGVDALMADRSCPTCRWCASPSPTSPRG